MSHRGSFVIFRSELRTMIANHSGTAVFWFWFASYLGWLWSLFERDDMRVDRPIMIVIFQFDL
jgi:hypothetical protein